MNRFLMALSVVSIVGCGGGRSSTIAALTGDATAGKAFYTASCEPCHGANGKSGTAKHDIVGHTKSSTIEAIDVLLSGNGQGMPAYASQTDQTLANVIAYLKSL